MNTEKTKTSYRWVVLRHIGAPDDLKGIHFDLLLEDDKFCRTWRLSDLPLLDGPYVDSLHIAPHKLEWLDIQQKVLCGNRGVATRIKKGIFFKTCPSIEHSVIKLSLKWENVDGDLVINENGCKIFSKK